MSTCGNIVGHIFDIQRFSIHDGPGIRSSVFLKGCNLRCQWCHNPESFFARPHELSFVPSNCISCGHCFEICPNQCHAMEGNIHNILRAKCTRCGLCAKECYSEALTIAGRSATVKEVMNEVMKDIMFYEASGGGLTLTGGEPLMQPVFARALLAMAKSCGIHTVVETNAVYKYAMLDGIKDNVDLFYVDFKSADPVMHKLYTGVDNAQVYANLAKFHDEDRKVLIRCPIVPGFNDTSDHFKAIADLTIRYPGFIGAELLPYHRLGISKINRFGLSGEVPHTAYNAPEKADEQLWINTVRGFGGRLVNESPDIYRPRA